MTPEQRYEIRYGKWGAYHHDTKLGRDLTLQEVAALLNSGKPAWADRVAEMPECRSNDLLVANDRIATLVAALDGRSNDLLVANDRIATLVAALDGIREACEEYCQFDGLVADLAILDGRDPAP